MARQKQTETEWLHSQLELIASNRAVRCRSETINEYKTMEKEYDLTSREIVQKLKEKYRVE